MSTTPESIEELRDTEPLESSTLGRADQDEAPAPVELASSPAEALPVDPRMSTDSIARRAYELFVERGGVHGYDVEDWLRAERELTSLEQQAASLTRQLNEPAN